MSCSSKLEKYDGGGGGSEWRTDVHYTYSELYKGANSVYDGLDRLFSDRKEAGNLAKVRAEIEMR